MIPYGKQTLDDTDINAVVDTLKSDFITQGSKVPAFESAIASYVSADHAIATSSATTALHIACLALNLTEQDIGWTVPLTFPASANAILYCQATVDFVDIDVNTGCICTQALEKKLIQAKLDNKLPKVLIVVHFAGISCDMETISTLCQPFNIKIIEDASHAIGGKYQGSPVGCCQFSDLTVFSFHPVKIITSGEGGMITTNDKVLTQKIRLLCSHGITKSTELLTDNDVGDWYYEQQHLGFNFRMSDIHAALGLNQLTKLDQFITLRNQQANSYKTELSNLPINILTPPTDCYASWHIFVIRLTEQASVTRLALYNTLKEKGIGCQVHYIPVHTHPFYKDLGFNWGDYPQAEHFYQHCLTIPIFPLLGGQQKKVIEQLQLLLQ